MSRSLENPIASGRTAEVYAWQAGYVLKLFREWFPLDGVEYEARIAGVIQQAGLPAPAAGEIVEINGRYGLVYERVIGMSMMKDLASRPWRVVRSARVLAELQARMHRVKGAKDLLALHTRLRKKIQAAAKLPPDLRETVLRGLEALPEGDRLCHGDFHPENILMTTNGAVIIDWIDATRGNPLADVARSTMITMGVAANDPISSNPFAKTFVRLFHAAYIRHYFRICPGGEREYRRWLPIVAAARLSENIPELEEWLVAQARKIK
jgi:aminoglycoside phosphotransferase (APT) family kinase protein